VVFGSFTEAAEYITEAGHEYGETELKVGRCTEPEWALRCAAVECREFADEDLTPHRHDHIALAAYRGWRRVDLQHWLCRPCSAKFTALPRY